MHKIPGQNFQGIWGFPCFTHDRCVRQCHLFIKNILHNTLYIDAFQYSTKEVLLKTDNTLNE